MMQFTQIALSEARQRGAQPRVATVPMSNADGSLLELAVLSKKAEEMGMKINDQGVLNYLTQLTDGKLAPHEFSNIWGNMVSERVSDKQLLNMMRRELMAIRVRGMMQSGNFPVSPVRYWDYYNRMERMVSAEVMPIEVSQFVSQVSEPSQSELSDFFEKYKNQYSSPQSPEPGFRQRRKAAFGYIKLDFEKFFEVELAAVTDEQVKEYYEKNKDDFQQMSFLEDDLESGLDAPDASTGAPGNPENDGTGSADSSEATTDDTTDGDDAAVPPAGADGTPTGPEATEAGSEVIEEVIKPESTPSPQPQDEATEGAAEAVKNVVEETAAIVQDGLESAAEKAVEAVKSLIHRTSKSKPSLSLTNRLSR
jgi:hypothetical protein